MRLGSLFLLLAACGGAPAAVKQPPAPAADPALPIAQYLGSDTLTGQRLFELLAANHIKSSAGGSLGYSVWVDGADRAKARQLLLAAVASECLAVTLFDDKAVRIDDARPARCTRPPPPAPVDHSK